jgi:hypothetical protein
MSSGLDFAPEDAHKAADKVGIPKGQKRAPHRTDWYSLDGRKLLRVSIPRHECRTGTRKNIVNSFRLNNSDFKRLYECSLSSSDYEKHIRRLVETGRL